MYQLEYDNKYFEIQTCEATIELSHLQPPNMKNQNSETRVFGGNHSWIQPPHTSSLSSHDPLIGSECREFLKNT